MCFEFNMGWRILVFYPEPEARLADISVLSRARGDG
jgi:hypothetical protein